jgi:hypothetical protein
LTGFDLIVSPALLVELAGMLERPKFRRKNHRLSVK